MYALKECFLISETMWIGLFIVLVKKVLDFELNLHLLNCALSNAKHIHLFQCIQVYISIIVQSPGLQLNATVIYWGASSVFPNPRVNVVFSII